MTVAAQLGEIQRKYEQIERAADFAAIARLLLAGRGQHHMVREIARTAPRVSERVKRIMAAPEAADFFVRAAQLPQTLAATPALSEYKIAVGGFQASLANAGIFDYLLGTGFRRLPLSLLTVGAINVGAVGVVVDEASAKPVSSLSISATTTTVRKAVSLLILTSELARATDNVDNLIGAELRTACVKAIDGKFLAIATAGVAQINSTGTNIAGFFTDLGIALNQMSIDDTSRLYIVMTSKNAKALSVMLAQASATSTGMGPRGGTVAGVEVIVSDSLAADTWVVVDSTAFAAAAGDLTLSTMSHASVQLDLSPDSPTSGATNLQSLWQLNQIGLLCERYFIVERLRSGAVSLVGGAQYGPGFSP